MAAISLVRRVCLTAEKTCHRRSLTGPSETRQHAGVVDIIDLEMGHLGDAQARAISDPERSFVLDAGQPPRC